MLFLFLALSFICVYCSPGEDKQARDAICQSVLSTGWCNDVLDFTVPVCDEPTIECDLSGNVVSVGIAGSGVIPTHLGLFRRLTSLVFQNTPTAASSIGQLPTQLGSLTSLRSLLVSGDFLQGAIQFDSSLPPEIGQLTALTRLEFALVDSTALNMPNELAQLTNLQTFSLFLANLAPSQTVLPAAVGSSPALRVFSVLFSNANGPLPQLGAKPDLEQYSVAGSAFISFDDDLLFRSPRLATFTMIFLPVLVSELPETFRLAQSLTVAVIEDVPFLGGELPDMVLFTDLRQFSLINTNVGGTIPASIARASGLTILEIVNNPTTGSLPDVFDALTQLTSLRIHGKRTGGCSGENTIDGPYPESLVHLMELAANLNQLDVISTCLSGTIPETRAPLPGGKQVETLLVTNNDLVDPLPQWLLERMATPVGANLCNLLDNRFCFKPAPLPSNGGGVCQFNIPNTVDECGVCLPPDDPAVDQSCRDCAGQVNGLREYDACDVCRLPQDNLRDTTCADCSGAPNGPAVYDSCDVCNGRNASLDCAGVCGGTSVRDACNVCDGDGTSCLDCSGVAFGTLVYDRCDICGGNDSRCVDCANEVGGIKIVDVCGDCIDPTAVDYVPSCCDCDGVPFGTKERDLCGVCGGDNSSCNLVQEVAALRGVTIFSPILIVLGSVFLVSLIVCVVCFITTAPAAARAQRRRPRPQMPTNAGFNAARRRDARMNV